ncbi:glycosyltransferase [Jatrophihabitans sp. GAS493]|uniref:glycosyltransferase family protein n=1 Tax=Jatrophihabitans sp. GAS493 TaxID=1907575 RepID=UPI0012FDC19E|nr:glycosyltransferase [Jatrophihabitans sp. GAS493]
MEELLAGVAAAVSATGVAVTSHRGAITDVADSDTVFVVVPHEYFAVTAAEHPALYARTIGFGVEHPGTETFESSVRAAAPLGADMQISVDSVQEMRRRGRDSTLYSLGYSSGWDRWHQSNAPRDIDVAYLGTSDARRLGLLAGFADEFRGLRTELLIPPHEPMTANRPDFLTGEAKWQLLARTKLLINLHRDGKTAFEWVRALEAMGNGCVVVTEPSTDIGRLVPGEHLLVAREERLGAVVRAALGDPVRIAQIARNAYTFARETLSMTLSAERLVELALPLRSLPYPSGSLPPPPNMTLSQPPMAVWLPGDYTLSGATHAADIETTELRRSLIQLKSERSFTRIETLAQGPGTKVDIICVRQQGDGPLSLTTESLSGPLDSSYALHVASNGIGAISETDPRWATHLSCDLPIGRGRARNMLVSNSSADLIFIVNGGDELIGASLAQLVDVMSTDSDIDIAFAMAADGRSAMANVLIPELRRLRSRAYLTRGYLVRRRWLESLGGFAEDPYLEQYVDHDFWWRSAERAATTSLSRAIGLRLWTATPDVGLHELDPERTRSVLAERANDAQDAYSAQASPGQAR